MRKQQNLRIMMKMHGLGDGPYWMISYAHFLFISSVYMLCFAIFGSVLGFKFFTLNAYSIQAVFYFIYINLQISVAFLVAAVFSNVRTATGGWIIVMELYPGFSLYRGLYKFGQSTNSGIYSRAEGLVWGELKDFQNGLREVMVIMFVEWWDLMFVAYYIDQVVSAGNGAGRSPLFFLPIFQGKRRSSLRKANLQRQGSKAVDQMEKSDVLREVERVEQLLQERDLDHAIISDNLKKIYLGQDGNPEKIAVQGMSLALPRGECFGLLGPNGAGKTSFINMLKGRYGGSYVLTMTTSSTHEEEVENLVSQISPGAKKVYQISGKQKFEMPKQDVRIADVFGAVEFAKTNFGVQAWGLADTTLEDVFVKVARGTQIPDILY